MNESTLITEDRQLTAKMRFLVLRRDDNSCRICGKKTDDLEVHHMQAIFLGGKTEIKNLIALCSDCHRYAPDTKEEFSYYMDSPEIFKMMALWNSCKGQLTKTVEDVEFGNVQDYYLRGFITKEVMESIIGFVMTKHKTKKGVGEYARRRRSKRA